MGLCHHRQRLRDPGLHLAHRLRRAGYQTHLVGFQHEGEWGRATDELGYATADQGMTHHSAILAGRAVEWLDRKPAGPFLLSVGLIETHTEFLPAEPPDDPRYAAPLPWLPDTPEIRQDMAELATAVRHVDHAVGMILAAIARNRLAGNTLVIFTTDHGLPFPKAKGTLYDAGIGVALIVRGPGHFAGGQVVDGLVGQIDLLPTILPLAGAAADGLAGRDLTPLLAGRTAAIRDEIWAELTYHNSYDPCRAVRDRRWKLIRSYEDRWRLPGANVDDTRCKAQLLRAHGIGQDPRPREQLFDCWADPHEFRDRSRDPEFAAIKAGLAGRLDAWMEETGDPLRHGPIPPPAGWTPVPADSHDCFPH
jgi:arylsulfatase A-like enzyme